MPIVYNQVSYSTAMELIDMFRLGRVQLTREEFDFLYDKVVEGLEAARDEIWRLANSRRDDLKSRN